MLLKPEETRLVTDISGEYAYTRLYVETLLRKIPPGTTTIYQADEKWHPFQIKDCENIKRYIDPNIKAGLLGEKKFKEFAKTNKIIIEEINQDPENLQQYKAIAEGDSIKRGDFILRAFSINIEIEVKTRTFYNNIEKQQYFTLKYHELKKLKRMQELISSKIIVFVFERINDFEVLDQLYAITIDEIFNLNKQQQLEYDSREKYLKIPINYCNVGIEGLVALCKAF